MTTLVLTGYDDAMRELGDLTTPLMEAYAARHGFDFQCFRDFQGLEAAYWRKIPKTIEAFSRGYGRVIWLDADQMVTNPAWVPLDEWIGFHASQDWGRDATAIEHFSMCGFVAGRDAIWLFDWIENNKAKYVNGPFPEQTPARHLYRDIQSTERAGSMTVHPRRVFNAVPIEVHETVVEPWKPGDWCAHLTMLAFPERVKLFHEIKSQAGNQ